MKNLLVGTATQWAPSYAAFVLDVLVKNTNKGGFEVRPITPGDAQAQEYQQTTRIMPLRNAK